MNQLIHKHSFQAIDNPRDFPLQSIYSIVSKWKNVYFERNWACRATSTDLPCKWWSMIGRQKKQSSVKRKILSTCRTLMASGSVRLTMPERIFIMDFEMLFTDDLLVRSLEMKDISNGLELRVHCYVPRRSLRSNCRVAAWEPPRLEP